MSPGRPRLPAGSDVGQLARAVERAGGRLIVVGGFVRDALRGVESHDLDLEVFGLSRAEVEAAIEGFGFSPPVGRARPVWRRVRDGLDLGFPIARDLAPRRTIDDPLEAEFARAALHRDLTVNAIGWDPLSDRLIDPFDGRGALADRCLAAVDSRTFGEDPLRLLRVARLQALLEARVAPELEALCRSLDLSGVPAERIAGELRRMLVDLSAPSRALSWLARIGRLDVLPPIAALFGVEQDPEWHPEGDVFVHTLLVLDCARVIASGLPSEAREILMWAALCHDLGKPATTRREAGRIRAHAHERESARSTRVWLTELRLSDRLVTAVEGLVAHHLAPSQLVRAAAGPRSYRRLARQLADAGCSLVDLERLARADHLGRTTDEARTGCYAAGDRFLALAESAQVESAPRPDLVRARDLIERGIAPGPELGRWLRRCRELEDEREARDAGAIIERVLAERGAGTP